MDYKTKRVMLLSGKRAGETISAPYPLYGTLIARKKAVLVLDDNAEDTA
jgi:hypothetical protein